MTIEERKSKEARGSLPAGDREPAGDEPVARRRQNPVLGAVSATSRKQSDRTRKGGQE